MARAVLKCQACRYSVLDAFTALAGVSVSAPRIQPLRIRPAASSARSIQTSSRKYHSIEAQKRDAEDEPPAVADDATNTSTTTTKTVPWYLAIDDPLPPLPVAPSPLLSRQIIPPLPDSPPDILSPVLEHLSINIGLDNLTLLDLRDLQPPPALGANLLMIIGTARSVKHLNVSADRFCRWLRTTYKLRPYADGLLGRNELKIKLRRKARRLKLARTAGRLDTDEAGRDDGITTGWVCVNVGPVDQVVVPEAEHEASGTTSTVQARTVAQEDEYDNEEIDEDEEDEYTNPPDSEVELGEATTDHDDTGYIGFGSRSSSQRIVVQMFTEEKRAEMDLEHLYTNRNTKMLRREEKADENIAKTKAWEEKVEARKRRKEEMKAAAAAESTTDAGEVVTGDMDGGPDMPPPKKEEPEWAPFFKNVQS